ncbi:MAG: hypothetical protein M3R07_01965 [Gemmatimonadota bacterium]|nr:hypothetical protein [Gemmatimonadota bacterium]
MKQISLERAERIARGHACGHCGEYNFKKLKVRRASEATNAAIGEVWHATKTCGVCDMQNEIGIDAEGDIIYGA